MIDIRPAALAEFARLPAIEAEADTLLSEIAGQPLRGPLPPPGTGPEFAAALHVLVAGHPPVGFARLENVDGLAHLEQLSVLPRWTGQGIGRALVQAAKAWAAEAGFSALTLCTFRDVPFNAPFYARCGFLPFADPGPELLELRRRESAAGLDALGARVVLRARLRPDAEHFRAPLGSAAVRRRQPGGIN
jgi:GNAT superfamily N-acetyltransferase